VVIFIKLNLEKKLILIQNYIILIKLINNKFNKNIIYYQTNKFNQMNKFDYKKKYIKIILKN
jgi:hypothetical protein